MYFNSKVGSSRELGKSWSLVFRISARAVSVQRANQNRFRAANQDGRGTWSGGTWHQGTSHVAYAVTRTGAKSSLYSVPVCSRCSQFLFSVSQEKFVPFISPVITVPAKSC